MIWLDIKKLEEKISKNELSEKDGFQYVLAFFILSALSMDISSQGEELWIRVLKCLLLVVVNIWGLNAAYKANTEIDGKDFSKRFFAISWVIGMRLLLGLLILVLILGIILGIIAIMNNTNDNDTGRTLIKELGSVVVVVLVEIGYYSLIRDSIRRLKPITD